MVDKAPKVRSSPRMALNAIVHYMSASAGQRESILRDQKFPPEFRQMWYKEATDTIVRFLLNDDKDEEILVRAIDRFHASGKKPHEHKRLKYNAEAVEGFLGAHHDLSVDDLRLTRGPKSGILVIERVSISVRPEVVLSGTYRSKKVTGGVKLYFSRNDRLTDDSAAISAAVMHEFMESGKADSVTATKRHCQVMDVFSGDVFAAPGAIVRRKRDLEAACREIALRWPSITKLKR